jgi:PAS domain S-box-containing protein
LEEIIIEGKQVKTELKESEKKYKDLVEEIPIGIASIGITGKIIYINKSLEKISDYSREEVVGKNVFKLGIFPNEMLKILKERWKVRLRGGSTQQRREIPFKCKDGKWIWIEITAMLIKKWGVPSSLRITVQDITERKKVEEELKNSEERLKILFDYAPDAYYINDSKGNFIDGNKAAEKVIGYKKEELIGRNFLKLKLLSLADIAKAAKLLVKNLRGQPTGPDEFVLNRKDNSKVTVEISTFPVKIKERTLVLGIARDITERKQAEEKIKHLNLVLRAIRNVNQLIVKEKNRERLLKGACNNLIKTRGYYSAWIALLDESGKFERYIEAGTGKAFLPMVEILMKGELTVCGQKALKQREIVIIKDPASTCPECPLVKKNSGRRVMTIRLEYSGKVYGFVSVSVPVHITVDKEEQSLFKEVAGDIAFSIHNIELDEELQQSYQKLKKTMDAAIDTMSKIIETKDPYTSGHQHRVCQLAVPLAQELGLSPDKIEGIRIASLIHDIGKIGLPTEILSKPTRLTDIEFSLIKGHSQIGYDILKSIDFSYPIAQIVLQHHERLNGSGYPNNLKGDKILLEAKIIGVADVVEAISSFRPYRPALGTEKALEEISQNRGILYDPKVVDACLKLFKEKGFKL